MTDASDYHHSGRTILRLQNIYMNIDENYTYHFCALYSVTVFLKLWTAASWRLYEYDKWTIIVIFYLTYLKMCHENKYNFSKI